MVRASHSDCTYIWKKAVFPEILPMQIIILQRSVITETTKIEKVRMIAEAHKSFSTFASELVLH